MPSSRDTYEAAQRIVSSILRPPPVTSPRRGGVAGIKRPTVFAPAPLSAIFAVPLERMSTERANGGQRSHSRTSSSGRGAAVQSSQAPQRASGEVGAFQIDDEDDDDGDGDDGEQSMSGNASRTRDETRDSFTDAASHVAGDESEDGHQRMPSNEFGSDCNDEDDYDEDAALAAALGAGGYTPYLGRLTAVACLGGLQFGWDTGIAAGMLVAIHQDLGHSLSAMEQEFIVSATTVGAIVGALSAGRLSDWMGRKKVMITAGIFFALGSIEQAASQVVRELILGRVIVGLGVGMASMVVPTYLAECAPPAIRGQIVSINALLITGGQVVAYIVDAAFYSLPHGWRWMVLAGGAPALIQLVGLIYLDESPRWLVAHGRHTSARHVLSRIYPEASPDTITRQIARIEDSISGSHLPFPAPSVSDVGSKAGQLREQFQQLWSDRSGRKALVLACGLQACQQLVGANSILYYSSRLLLMAGFKTNPNVAAIWIAVANFIGTAIALRLIDRTGRRMLLLRATAGATISLAFLAIALSQIDTGEVTDGGLGDVNQAAPGAWTYICLLAMISFLFTYALGLGIVPWLVQSEVFSGSSRGIGGGLATATNWTVNLASSATFLDLVRVLSPQGCFFFYSAIGALTWVFAYTQLPELAGVSIDDVRAALDGTLGTANGSSYAPVAQNEGDNEQERRES